MKKIFAMLLLMPSLALANPKIQKDETICLNSNELTETINEFKELPYVRGISVPISRDDVKFSLVVFVNPKTGSFTIAEKRADNLYCIIAIGTDFAPVPKELQDDLRQQQEKSTL
jgi:hypothetical protein